MKVDVRPRDDPSDVPGADLGGGCSGCTPSPEMTCGFPIQLVFCQKKKLCGLLVLKYSKRRVHPLLKKISATSSSEWSSIFQNVQKEDNLARYTQIFGNFYRKFSFHSTLLPEFLEFTVEWLAFLKFNSFFLYHLPLFPIFQKFWLTGGSVLSETFDLWPRP